ncbi:MAG: hypothetical protein F7C35_04845 [Desulfurococcales archaeon]|nr:hypothetical protein [Desulfurococcales archaeon]
MQGLRGRVTLFSIITSIIIISIISFNVIAVPPCVEILSPNITDIEGSCSDGTYTVTLTFNRQPRNITVLDSDGADITWLLFVRVEENNIIISNNLTYLTRLEPAEYHIVLINGTPVLKISYVPAPETQTPETSHTSTTTTPTSLSGTGGSTGGVSASEAKRAPPPVEGDSGYAPEYKGSKIGLITVLTGLASIVSAVIEYGRNREGDRGAKGG